MTIGSPGIAAIGISYHLSDGALPTWYIPDAARHLIDHDRWCLSGLLGLGSQGVIAAVYNVEQAVGLLLTTKEHTVEAYPLGTG